MRSFEFSSPVPPEGADLLQENLECALMQVRVPNSSYAFAELVTTLPQPELGTANPFYDNKADRSKPFVRLERQYYDVLDRTTYRITDVIPQGRTKKDIQLPVAYTFIEGTVRKMFPSGKLEEISEDELEGQIERFHKGNWEPRTTNAEAFKQQSKVAYGTGKSALKSVAKALLQSPSPLPIDVIKHHQKF